MFPYSSLMPPSPFLVAHSPDLKELSVQFDRWTWGQNLWRNQQQTLESIEGLRSYLENFDRETSMSLAQFATPFTRQGFVALGRGNAFSPSILAAFEIGVGKDPKPDVDSLHQNFLRLLTLIQNSGAPGSAATMDHRPLAVYREGRASRLSDGRLEIGFGFAGSSFLLGIGNRNIEQAIDRFSDKRTAAKPPAENVGKADQPNALLSAWIQPSALPPQGSEEAAWLPVEAADTFRKFNSLAATVAFSAEGQARIRAFFSAGAPKDLFAAFGPAVVSKESFRMVPRDADFALAASLNPAKILEEITQNSPASKYLLAHGAQISREHATQPDAVAMHFLQMMGFPEGANPEDAQKEVLDALKGTLLVYHLQARETSPGGWVAVADHLNQAAFERLMERVKALGASGSLRVS